jgi:hypothetical protein
MENEIIRRGADPSKKKHQRACSLSEEKQCKGLTKQPSASQKESPHQNQTLSVYRTARHKFLLFNPPTL